MISEKWSLGLNIEMLRSHLQRTVFDKEFTRQSEVFGGWSVLSHSGDFRDGWEQGHLLLKEHNLSPKATQELTKIINKVLTESTIETDICTGYLKEVIALLRSHKLSPNRARIICLSAGSACSWHSDMPENKYAVRLHIPIITNPYCFFQTRTESEHLPADGSAYFIYVNREHRVINNGTTDRFHLVVDVKDEVGLTKHHRVSDFKMRYE